VGETSPTPHRSPPRGGGREFTTEKPGVEKPLPSNPDQDRAAEEEYREA